MKKIFEYTYSYFFSETGSVYVNEDGSLYTYTMPLRLLKKDEDMSAFGDKFIFKSPEMVSDIKAVIEQYEVILKKLPKHFDNPDVLDGASEEIRVGKWKIEGHNIINAESLSDMTFETVSSLDEYFRGEFYSSEIQKVYRDIKKIIDSYNKTGICLWESDRLPDFPDRYTEEIEGYLSEEDLKPKTYRIGDNLPFMEMDSKEFRLTGIKQVITEFFADFVLGPKHSLNAELKKGHFWPVDYKPGKKTIPVLLRVEDIDTSSITLRICGIRKDFLKKHWKQIR